MSSRLLVNSRNTCFSRNHYLHSCIFKPPYNTPLASQQQNNSSLPGTSGCEKRFKATTLHRLAWKTQKVNPSTAKFSNQSSSSIQGLSQQKDVTGQAMADQPIHTAVIALGSNMGDRIDIIELACRSMQERGIWIKANSFLYETLPMYVTDQPSFYNAACQVRP